MKPSVPLRPFLIQNPAFSCHRGVLFCGWLLGALLWRAEHGGSLGGLEYKIKATGVAEPEILTCFMSILGGRGSKATAREAEVDC